jgi:cytoskeletal protein CcmA (bactofilin family)
VVFRRDNRDTKQPETFARQLEPVRQAAPPPEAEDEMEDQYEQEATYTFETPAREPAPAERQPERGGSAYQGYQSRDQRTTTYQTTPDAGAMSYTSNQPTSVIAADTVWRGELESNGDVHIHGQMQGTITARTDIFVSEDAEADATLVANAIVIAGNVKGVIRATTRLEVLPQGRVSGEIIAPTLIAHDGSRVNASVRMTLTPEEQAVTPPRISTGTRRTSRATARY